MLAIRRLHWLITLISVWSDTEKICVYVCRFTMILNRKRSFPTFCKQTFPQFHKIASYAHYAQCRLLRNPSHTYIFFEYHKQDRFRDSGMIYSECTYFLIFR